MGLCLIRTLGSNPGCGSDGFSAAIVPGYDPVLYPISSTFQYCTL